jgi:hypothetical protein
LSGIDFAGAESGPGLVPPILAALGVPAPALRAAIEDRC